MKKSKVNKRYQIYNNPSEVMFCALILFCSNRFREGISISLGSDMFLMKRSNIKFLVLVVPSSSVC